MATEATGMLFVLSTCNTADKVEDFQRWYETVHIPDVLATGIFLGASFGRAPDSTPDGQPTSIAEYETTAENLGRVMDVIRASVPEWHARGHANPELKVLHTGTFLKRRTWDAPARE
jgi:hypothetical protein